MAIAALMREAEAFGDFVFEHLLNTAVQEQIIAKRLRLFVIDGNRVAREAGMGGRVNTVMQACFFAISGVLPRDEAIAAIKHAIEKTYGKRGEAVVHAGGAPPVDEKDADIPVPGPVAAAGRRVARGGLGHLLLQRLAARNRRLRSLHERLMSLPDDVEVWPRMVKQLGCM